MNTTETTTEPIAIITVRLSKSVHEAVKMRTKELSLERMRAGLPSLSMNSFCLEALLEKMATPAGGES